MKGRLDLCTRGGALAAALILGGIGCAQSVKFDPHGGTGGTDTGGAVATGGGGTGGAGGATTTTMTGCVGADDCASFSGPCVVGTCINGACTALPANDSSPCDDGKFCTLGDTCQKGVCQGGATMTCPGGDACHVGACDEASQGCVQQPGNNGAQCDDKDSCTYFGTCSGGTCMKGPPIDCTFLDGICTQGVCDPGVGCKSAPKNNGFPCEDGQFCTEGDTCQSGQCTGGPAKQCAPPGGCFIGSCDEINDACTSVPGNNGAACDDGSPCTANTSCLNGVCASGTPVNDGVACDDGTSCTSDTTCLTGVCTGGMGPLIYFADDFKDASKGWTLGPEWQIGPATVSIPGQGNPDPGEDHTITADDGVAGVVIGGNAQTMLHPYYYMESPPFDTSAAPGDVVLGFYRWLNSDYDPFMHNSVEVFDGVTWVQVWVTGGPPGVMDAAWNYNSYDLTAYKNASMRVRFGFDITSGGVYTIGSWNIDDVLVASGACP